ncbi:thioredoxin domain-containing protein [Nocardioides marmoriginsengisoli]|uniref:Thioredoxin domain-containing protein n=1 Tax=Nocardioides marmoriginsengisoli TaxID=661483 RepID=A0A3N0CDL0_9ACTN|nr:thioredoxin domain-containing protein [Nocardioides marmoriginsengisoli]RNL61321.1 thioredoxin domain-containing protein [Nocardioides marmoriginsengisoli]
MANRLASATSPYLLQHKDNPVDWWEWGPEAFAEARRRDAPILLSAGYAACHWCHVMAHESFEDATTAAYMNEHFVNVKVDREERPDVDAVYMQATVATTGSGGWPMTCVLDLDGRPFFAGTYFPDQPRHGQPSFTQLLQAIAEAWRERRDDVTSTAENIAAHLAANADLTGTAPIDATVLDAAAARLGREFDAQHGGFGGSPKFPPSMLLEFLLRRDGSADRAVAGKTLEAMARGGIYDQLGGGFARYSVDARWVVPHFEKMLYDNALLLSAYTSWYAVSDAGSDQERLARRIASETAGFLLDELSTPEGGFSSALDADSEGAEGTYYVWTPAQLVEVLGADDGAWAAELLTVTPGGTFEHGSSVLQLLGDPDDSDRWASVRERLLAARALRERPGEDDKVVAAWNGLAIAALARAAGVLGEPRLLDAAVRAGRLLVELHLVDGRLRRVSRHGEVGRHAGVLEDYGCVADGFVALAEATGDGVWLEHAGRLLDIGLDQFGDGSGGFHDTAADAEALITRPRDPSDNASPSGHSAITTALLRYAALTGSGRHRDAAEAALAAVRTLAEKAPRFAGWSLAAAQAALDGPLEIVVVTGPGDPVGERLAARARRSLGSVVLVVGPEQAAASSIPLLAGRGLVEGRAAAYVCRGMVCERPVTDPEVLLR